MKKAFTLIELLVVVLIIGILSAVALPQYQKAVQKARYTQLMTLGDGLYKAVQVYMLANGTGPETLEELDISVPGELSDDKKSITVGGYWCFLGNGGAGGAVKSINCRGGLKAFYRAIYIYPGHKQQLGRYCEATSTKGDELCKLFGTFAWNNGEDNLYYLK